MPDFFPWWVVITHFLNIFLLSVHDLARSRNRHREIGLHAAHCGGGGSRRRDNTTDQQAEAGEQRTRQRWQQAHEGPFKIGKTEERPDYKRSATRRTHKVIRPSAGRLTRVAAW